MEIAKFSNFFLEYFEEVTQIQMFVWENIFAQNLDFVHKNANCALKAFKCSLIRGG